MQNQKFNIGKNERLCVRYSNGEKITHILVKKLQEIDNKTWILLSVENDGTLKKVAQGSNPLKLEDKIDYMKAHKDKLQHEDDTI